MDVHTVARYLQQGYRIRRRSWVMTAYVYEIHGHLWGSGPVVGKFSYSLDLNDLMASDWEIITKGITKDFPITYSD